ncbi:MAG TPA: RICIN domain-containing protein, partial [Chitinophagaceae bacterium]|nr:RICIN domain-containing protein [Chitinophagaceae bacterium]
IMKKLCLLLNLLFFFSFSKSWSQVETTSTQADWVATMMSFVSKVVDKADISITTNLMAESDQTKTLSGNCNFFGVANVQYTGKFDQGGKLTKFIAEIPFLQQVNPSKVSKMLKSGDWMNLFLPDEIKDGIFLSKYYIDFTQSMTVENVGADFTFQPVIPLFGLKTLRISNITIGYKIEKPLTTPNLTGVFRGSVLWGDPTSSNVITTTLETNLVRDPKKWSISIATENVSINSVFQNFGLTQPLVPANVNSLLTVNKAKLTVKPFAYSFLFEATTPLITVNFLVKRVDVDGKPIATDTLNANTSLTGAYTAKPTPPADDPDPPPTPPAEVKPVPQKTHSWGIMIGFSLPESNDEVQAIKWMRKIQLTNIGVVFSSFKDATTTNLPIFANLGSGETLLEKGFSFVSWISVNDLFTKFKLLKPLKSFSTFMQQANPVDNIMFRAHVPLDINSEFSLEGDINFNEKMQLVPMTHILDLKQLKLEVAVTPTSTNASFSFGAVWDMMIDPTRNTPLTFAANMSVVPNAAAASVTLAVSGQMNSAWSNPYGMLGLGINSPKFKMGLSFSDALIPIPDDIFITGQMMYGKIVGDVTLGINYNELMKNMLMARVCNLSMANAVDQFSAGMIKTKWEGTKSKYLSMLDDVLNMELKDVYFKAILSDNSDLMAGLRMEANYMDKCGPATAPDQNWLLGVRLAGAAKFAGFNGNFDMGVEGSLSSLSGGITMKAKMDRINITSSGYTIFRFSGAGEMDPFELYLDLSSNNLLNGVKGLLSDPNGSKSGIAIVTSGVPIYIRAKHSGKQINVEGASKNMQAKLQQWTSNTSGAQQFTFETVADGYYSIRNMNSSMNLDVQNGLPVNGQPVWQYVANTTPAQQFKLVPKEGEYFEIESRLNPNLVLDFNGTSDGAPLTIRTRANSANQQFQLIPVEPTTEPLAAGSDRIFYLSGGLNILEAGQGRALIELTPTGYKATVKGKIYKFLDGTIDATIGSFRDIPHTTFINAQVNVGAIQQKIIDGLSNAIGNIPFFNELKKGFVLKSISFSGYLDGLKSSATAKMLFKVAGQSFSPGIVISMNSTVDFLVNTVVARIRETASGAIAYAKKLFDDAIVFAANTAKQARDAAVAAYNLAKQTTQAAISTTVNLKNKIVGVAQASYAAVKDGALKAAAKLQQFLIDFGGFSRDFVAKIYKQVQNAFENGWSSFKNAFEKAFTHADNEELILYNGPAYRIYSKIQNGVLKSPISRDRNYPVELGTPNNSNTAYWQIDPCDEDGKFYLVSGYSGMSITKARHEKNQSPFYCTIIPHESDHKSRERMIMEPVPNEPGWYFLKYANNNIYVAMKTVTVNINNLNRQATVLTAIGAKSFGDEAKFRFEMAGLIDWKYLKDTPSTFPPRVNFIADLKEG